jgi:hypothetical protein
LSRQMPVQHQAVLQILVDCGVSGQKFSHIVAHRGQCRSFTWLIRDRVMERTFEQFFF